MPVVIAVIVLIYAHERRRQSTGGKYIVYAEPTQLLECAL